MATSSAKRNFNISIASDNADFIKRNGMNLSKAVDTPINEMRRIKTREEWAAENQAALAERCRVLESEGGSAAERRSASRQFNRSDSSEYPVIAQ